jgi:hypothetical protein
MKPKRSESRWAKMRRWADAYEAGREERERRAQEHERRAQEYEIRLARQREAERLVGEKRQKQARSNEVAKASRPLILVLVVVFFACAQTGHRFQLVQREVGFCGIPYGMLRQTPWPRSSPAWPRRRACDVSSGAL